jgi:hypothetical protein
MEMTPLLVSIRTLKRSGARALISGASGSSNIFDAGA